MANLKELKTKIGAIESTRKVTAAMKLVAGVKLRKAEAKATSSRAYSSELNSMIARIRAQLLDKKYELFSGRDEVKAILLIVFASDKGLCGNFNYLINKKAKEVISGIHNEGKKLKLICIGHKLIKSLKAELNESDSIEIVEDFYNSKNMFEKTKELGAKIVDYYRSEMVDKVSILYTMYHSAMHKNAEVKDIIPITCEPNNDQTETIFEPSAEKIMNDILPYNVCVQLYQAALESITSEQSSRMTSMDSATKNADTLLSDFKMQYNRGRQLKITQELTEIIAGAKAVEG